jgi:hypothetical protein
MYTVDNVSEIGSPGDVTVSHDGLGSLWKTRPQHGWSRKPLSHRGDHPERGRIYPMRRLGDLFVSGIGD